MDWFRFYSEALDDPKVQRLAGELFKGWVNLLCLANRGKPRGMLPELGDIAFALRLSEAQARKLVDELVRHGLLDNHDGLLVPHGWAVRQQHSDTAESAAERKRRQRDRERKSRGCHSDGHGDGHGDVTVQKQIQKQRREETTAAADAREEPGSDVPTADPDQVPTLSPALQTITTANAALRANPLIDQERLRPIKAGHGASVQAVHDWLADGIPLGTVLDVVDDRCRSYAPSDGNPQIHSLVYLDRAVREEHDRRTGAAPSVPRGGGRLPRRSPAVHEYVGSISAGEF